MHKRTFASLVILILFLITMAWIHAPVLQSRYGSPAPQMRHYTVNVRQESYLDNVMTGEFGFLATNSDERFMVVYSSNSPFTVNGEPAENRGDTLWEKGVLWNSQDARSGKLDFVVGTGKVNVSFSTMSVMHIVMFYNTVYPADFDAFIAQNSNMDIYE